MKINRNNYEACFIDYLEGDLTEPEKSVFETYLAKHPEKQKEAELFSKTKLIPDKSVIFSKKNRLYRKPAGKTVLLWTVRIAAVLILAIVIYNLTDKPVSPFSEENKTAQTVNEIQENDTNTEAIEPTGENAVKNETTLILAEATASVAENINSLPASNNDINSVKTIEIENKPAERIQLEIPATINPLPALFNVEVKHVSLVSAGHREIITETVENNERLIVNVIKEKIGTGNFIVEKIKKVGLTLVAGFTRDNFSCQIDEDGRISEISYDSRLLAITIPTGNRK